VPSSAESPAGWLSWSWGWSCLAESARTAASRSLASGSRPIAARRYGVAAPARSADVRWTGAGGKSRISSGEAVISRTSRCSRPRPPLSTCTPAGWLNEGHYNPRPPCVPLRRSPCLRCPTRTRPGRGSSPSFYPVTAAMGGQLSMTPGPSLLSGEVSPRTLGNRDARRGQGLPNGSGNRRRTGRVRVDAEEE